MGIYHRRRVCGLAVIWRPAPPRIGSGVPAGDGLPEREMLIGTIFPAAGISPLQAIGYRPTAKWNSERNWALVEMLALY